MRYLLPIMYLLLLASCNVQTETDSLLQQDAVQKIEVVTEDNFSDESSLNKEEEKVDLLEIIEASSEEYATTWERLYYHIKLPKNSPKSAQNALKMALQSAEYHNVDRLNKTTWMMVVDFTQHSKENRGYLINIKTGITQPMRVSHGSNSGGPYATVFSNVDGSHQSSLGLYLTKGTYYGSHKYSLKLEGLESTNDNALERLIVIHAAYYVADKWVAEHGYTGRSWGCPAVDPSLATDLINKLKGGSYYYIYHNKFSNK